MGKRAAAAPPRRAPERLAGAKRPADEQTKRLTVDIPESLHTRIKIACARNKLKMKALVMEGLNRALEQYE